MNDTFKQVSEEDIRMRYETLCNVCNSKTEDNTGIENNIKVLENIIAEEITAISHACCLDNANDVLECFRLDMTFFREFFEYPQLSTKTVVGIGGSFSSGKSSLINTLLGDRKLLVTQVDPTTSIPTYLTKCEDNRLHIHAINFFNNVVSLSYDQFKTLTHDEKQLYGSSISTLLKSVIVSHKSFPWNNIALLDTPGYSKAEESESARTDESLSRVHLNRARFILWLVPADKGAIPEEDIIFLSSLNKDIPKVIIISRSDKHTEKDIKKIKLLVKENLKKRGVKILDIVYFTNRKSNEYYSLEPLLYWIDKWNTASVNFDFSKQFKITFKKLHLHLNKKLKQKKTIKRDLSKISLLTCHDINIEKYIFLPSDINNKEIKDLELLKQKLNEVEKKFFTILKEINDALKAPLYQRYATI